MLKVAVAVRVELADYHHFLRRKKPVPEIADRKVATSTYATKTLTVPNAMAEDFASGYPRFPEDAAFDFLVASDQTALLGSLASLLHYLRNRAKRSAELSHDLGDTGLRELVRHR